MHVKTFLLRSGAVTLTVASLVACTTPQPQRQTGTFYPFPPSGPPAPGVAPSPPPPPALPQPTAAFIRPASGALISGFDGQGNKGIDIAGNMGDPVLASADGRVVYVGGELRGYGNMVIVKHNETYLTAYAHAQHILVKERDVVRQGQKIAEMGNSDADRVKLHFEIRKQGVPVDPEPYLSGRLR